MLIDLGFPVEPFNTYVRDGSAGERIAKILDDLKPEAVYFTEQDGQRGGIMIIDVASPSDVPRIAEPFFLTFEAEVRFHVCMTPDDLAKAGLEGLGDKWG
jgi:hypothetical protein